MYATHAVFFSDDTLLVSRPCAVSTYIEPKARPMKISGHANNAARRKIYNTTWCYYFICHPTMCRVSINNRKYDEIRQNPDLVVTPQGPSHSPKGSLVIYIYVITYCCIQHSLVAFIRRKAFSRPHLFGSKVVVGYISASFFQGNVLV